MSKISFSYLTNASNFGFRRIEKVTEQDYQVGISAITDTDSDVQFFDDVVESSVFHEIRSDQDWLLNVNNYEVKAILGHGSYGRVYKVAALDEIDGADKFQQEYALKEIATPNRNRTNGSCLSSQLLREISILKRNQHKSLIRLKEVIHDFRNINMTKTYIIMEYLTLGPIMKQSTTDPHRFICTLTGAEMGEALASKYFRELCDGMAYLHANCIAHRDLKTDNILLDANGSIRITDFGVSQEFDRNSSGRVLDSRGTPAYFAPEMYDTDENSKFSAYKVDVWAAGVCLWVFLFGSLPFNGDTSDQLMDQILLATPELPHAVSHEADTMFKCLLNRAPQKRPFFKDCLKMDFIAGFESDFDDESCSKTNHIDDNVCSAETRNIKMKSLGNDEKEKILQFAQRAKENVERRKRYIGEQIKMEAKAAESKIHLARLQLNTSFVGSVSPIQPFETSERFYSSKKSNCFWCSGW